MKVQTVHLRKIAFLIGVAVLAFSGWANADPPSRVARFETGDLLFKSENGAKITYWLQRIPMVRE